MEWDIIIPGVAAFIGAVIGHLVTAYSARKDRSLRLSMAVIERRLETHQKASSTCEDIYSYFWRANPDPGREGLRMIVAAQTWFSENHVYLDGDTKKHFQDFLIVGGELGLLIYKFHQNKIEYPELKEKTNELAMLLKKIRDGVNLPPIKNK